MGTDAGQTPAELLGEGQAEAAVLLRRAVAVGPPGVAGEGELDALLPLVYRRLRAIARDFLSREREAHTLSPTALVHEAYLRLLEQRQVSWRSGAHVVALAALMMRRVLVNHAVARDRKKRGQGWKRLTVDTGLERLGLPGQQRELDLVEIDDLLRRLATLDPRQARVVELRFFGGMGIEEIGEALDVSPATVKREWATARLWLLRELRAG
ncbi:MAG TPA: ECF-type sigma factor [Anaeromyxobacter sp.]|nr:ECF-type sigma factor [Anaeromyxobacter sp.]